MTHRDDPCRCGLPESILILYMYVGIDKFRARQPLLNTHLFLKDHRG